MRALQGELDNLRDLRAREKERETRRAQADEEELQILRDRCERLEEERNSGVGIVRLNFEIDLNLTSFAGQQRDHRAATRRFGGLND